MDRGKYNLPNEKITLDKQDRIWYDGDIMEHFSETYIKNGKLCKTKKHFYMCPKCGLVQVCPSDDSYQYGLCWICFLKLQGYYKSAMEEIKNGWFTWSTHISDVKIGWSFAEKVQWCKIFMSVLKCGSLNKTPKIPIDAKPQDYDWSDWQVQTANEYYPKLKYGMITITDSG